MSEANGMIIDADSDDDEVVICEQYELIEVDDDTDDEFGNTSNSTPTKTRFRPQPQITRNLQYDFAGEVKRIPTDRNTVEELCKYFGVDFKPEKSLQHYRKIFKDRTRNHKRTPELQDAIARKAHYWCRRLVITFLPNWFQTYHVITLIRLMSSFNVNKPTYWVRTKKLGKRNKLRKMDKENSVRCVINFLNIEDCRQLLYDLQGLQCFENNIQVNVTFGVINRNIAKSLPKALNCIKQFRLDQAIWCPKKTGMVEIHDSEEVHQSYSFPVLADVLNNFKESIDPVLEVLEQNRRKKLSRENESCRTLVMDKVPNTWGKSHIHILLRDVFRQKMEIQTGILNENYDNTLKYLVKFPTHEEAVQVCVALNGIIIDNKRLLVRFESGHDFDERISSLARILGTCGSTENIQPQNLQESIDPDEVPSPMENMPRPSHQSPMDDNLNDPQNPNFVPQNPCIPPPNTCSSLPDPFLPPPDPSSAAGDPSLVPQDPCVPPPDPSLAPKDPCFPPVDPCLPSTDSCFSPVDPCLPPPDTCLPPSDPSFPSPNLSIPATDPSFPSPNLSIPATDPTFPSPNLPPTDPSFPAPNPSILPTDPCFPLPNSSIPPMDPSFPTPNLSIPLTDPCFPAPYPNSPLMDSCFPPDQNIPPTNPYLPPPYPSLPPPYPRFSPPNTHFSPPNSHFSPPNAHFPPPNAHLSPPNPNFSPPHPRFSPPNPRFPRFAPRSPQFGPRNLYHAPRNPHFAPRNPQFAPRSRNPHFVARNPHFAPRNSNFAPRNPRFQRNQTRSILPLIINNRSRNNSTKMRPDKDKKPKISKKAKSSPSFVQPKLESKVKKEEVPVASSSEPKIEIQSIKQEIKQEIVVKQEPGTVVKKEPNDCNENNQFLQQYNSILQNIKTEQQ